MEQMFWISASNQIINDRIWISPAVLCGNLPSKAPGQCIFFAQKPLHKGATSSPKHSDNTAKNVLIGSVLLFLFFQVGHCHPPTRRSCGLRTAGGGSTSRSPPSAAPSQCSGSGPCISLSIFNQPSAFQLPVYQHVSCVRLCC